MKEDKDKLESLFNERFSNKEMEVPAHLWESISQQMPVKKTESNRNIIFLTALLSIFLTSTVWYAYLQSLNHNSTALNIAQKKSNDLTEQPSLKTKSNNYSTTALTKPNTPHTTPPVLSPIPQELKNSKSVNTQGVIPFSNSSAVARPISIQLPTPQNPTTLIENNARAGIEQNNTINALPSKDNSISFDAEQSSSTNSIVENSSDISKTSNPSNIENPIAPIETIDSLDQKLMNDNRMLVSQKEAIQLDTATTERSSNTSVLEKNKEMGLRNPSNNHSKNFPTLKDSEK